MRRRPPFGLQAVLDHFRHIEEAALRVVAQSQRVHAANFHEAARLRNGLERHLRSQWFGSDVRIGDLRVREEHVEALRRAAGACAAATQLSGQDLDAARCAAVKAARKRRSFERLRDRQAAVFQARRRRSEEREIVETARGTPSLIQID